MCLFLFEFNGFRLNLTLQFCVCVVYSDLTVLTVWKFTQGQIPIFLDTGTIQDEVFVYMIKKKKKGRLSCCCRVIVSMCLMCI